MNNERIFIMRKSIFNFIETLNPNDIKSFKASDDRLKVVLTLTDGEETEFPINNGFGVFEFYQLIEKLTGEKAIKTVFTDVNGYVGVANHVMTNIYIKNILSDLGSNASVKDVGSIMLDGFRHTNLFELAKQENNLKKYVLIALNLLNELKGDANAIYKDNFRQRVLKVGA